MGDDTIETTIDIDTKNDVFVSYSEKEADIKKNDCPTQPHNGKNIDCIVVSQDESYAVTYSREDTSIQGWSINVEENQQKPDVCFEFNLPYKVLFALYKRMLLFYYYDDKRKFQQGLIDFSGGKDRIQTLQLEHAEKLSTNQRWIGFFPNGDVIIVSLDKKLKDYKIYLYSFINKPTDADATLWEYSQIYKIEFHESLNEYNHISCFVVHQKLFLLNDGHLTQWDLDLDLLTITFDMQYNLFSENLQNIVINKNQTLLASYDEINQIDKIDIYSMKSGIRTSRYESENYYPTSFVTLKDGSEGLIIRAYDDDETPLYEFLDPFHPSGAIDITNDITNNITRDRSQTFITKTNKQFYIKENYVWVKNFVNEDRFPNKACHSDIYTSSIFTTIQNMLNDINNNVCYDFPERSKIELTDGEYFRFNLERLERGYGDEVEVKGLIRNNNKWEETQSSCVSSGKLVSYKKLDNQALALITTVGIYIYTIVKDLRLRYFWSNKELYDYYDSNDDDGLVNYKKIIQKILNNEFKDSLSSPPLLPIPDLEICSSYNDYHDLVLGIINDREDFPRFICEILDIAITAINIEDNRKKREFGDKIIKLVFGKILELIKEEDYSSYMKLLPVISLKLPELCDGHYSSLVIKYILHTLILLDPSCTSIKNLTNTSLYAYSKDIYVKKSMLSNNNYFKSLFSSFYKILSHHLKMQKILISSFYHRLRTPKIQIPTISFIVPFPQICNYHNYKKKNNYNPWNDILYQPKSILFCNIDSNNLYGWWNFAAIIDFKWKTFGKFYYFLIWSFFTIFFICFAIATTLDLHRKIFFIISILFGLAHLFFEFRQFLWKPRYYIKDPWNLFDVGAYSLPIITSIYWLINGPSLPLAAISILLLTFKFLLFFRVFQSYGKYFAIIVGVAEEVFPFLVVLLFIIFGFGFSFFILLKSTDSSLDQPAFNDDPNNPWNLATKYNSINPDGTINPDATLIQTPDSKTNMFSWFSTSILAMYLFLTGDSGSLSSWTYIDDPMMTILLFLFTFTTVIYLMNLFIGLLNMAIDKYNKHEEFLLSVARILVEIELFYMLPYQRHKKEWFPDWIYYHIPVDDVHKLINAIDNNKTEFYSLPFISKGLRTLIEISEPTDDIKDELEQTKDELKQTKDELKQTRDELNQELKEVKNLLNSLIKKLSIDSDDKQ